MVMFGIEYNKNGYATHSNNNREPYLVITTNEITNEIVEMIDTKTTKNIAFQIPINCIGKRDITFDFKVDIWVWRTFVREITHLEFRGKLVKNQLNAEHVECMTSVRCLYIGSTDYPLFENEDTSKLPLINVVLLNGYGMVIGSENMEKWLERSKLNGCRCERYI